MDHEPVERIGPTDWPGEAVLCCSSEAVITGWSAAAERLVGYAAAEVVGQHLARITPPDDDWAGLLSDPGSARTPRLASVVAKDGRHVAVVVRVTPLQDRRGAIQGACIVLGDAGKRRRLEEANARLAAIVDGSEDAIVSKTLAGVITSWNRGAERLFGYSAEEAIGRSITLVIPPERLGEEIDVLARIRRGETVSHFETVRVRKDGARVDMSLTVSPIRDPSGAVVGASKIARDITERRRVERERASLLAEVQRASAAKDEFIAMLGHELRNPLGAITSAIHLLEAAEDDPASLDSSSAAVAGRARGVIRRQSTHLARMVDDLLDVGRIITGKIVLDVKPIDLAEEVRRDLEGLRAAGRLDDHAVTLHAEHAIVRADSVRIEQILANLVNNAVRHTPPGGAIRVVVEARSDEATLIVEDEGSGFEPQLASGLFELFAQGKRSIDRRNGGLGIGLTLVRRIAELHGGRADAVSPGPGRGSRFRVHLPLVAVEPGAIDVPEPPPDRAERGVRVLAVEDNPDAREMLESLLSLFGYDVRTAPDGEEGLALAEEWQPELLLLDIGLPKLDGYELCRRVRARFGKGPYIVALTGYGAADDVRRAHEAGFDLHLTKPARPNDLSMLAERARERQLQGAA